MGLFDRFFGRGAKAAPDSPEALRQRLFKVVHSGDNAALTRLCAEHEAAILEYFQSWLKVPEGMRKDQASLQRYGEGLVGLAQCMAETRNRPELLELMMGPPGGNPIVQWQETLGRANGLMNRLDFDGALQLLTPELERIRGLSGGHAESMKAMTFGQLATCHFQSGRPEMALPIFQQALELCRSVRDEEGVLAYLGSLFEAHRYLGQGAEAANVATEYAAALERRGQSERARRQRKIADIVRRGEPLNRVVAELGGVTFELDELPSRIEGGLRFIFCRNRIALVRTEAMVERGRELGQKGRFEEALALFKEARRLDPHAPEPRYDGALTLLHLQRASEAVAWYDEAEALAPGWYHCRADRWLAAGIAAGEISHQAFMLLRMLESPDVSAEERVQLARRGSSDAAGVPEFQLHLGRLLASLGREDEAREALAAGLRQAEEPDIRSRLLVESAAWVPPSAERDRRLHEAMEPGGNLVAAAMARVMLFTETGQRQLH